MLWGLYGLYNMGFSKLISNPFLTDMFFIESPIASLALRCLNTVFNLTYHTVVPSYDSPPSRDPKKPAKIG